MKNIKVQIFGLLILLCAIVPLDGMFSYSKQRIQRIKPRKSRSILTQPVSPEGSVEKMSSNVDINIEQPSLWKQMTSYLNWRPKEVSAELLGPKIVSPEEIKALLIPIQPGFWATQEKLENDLKVAKKQFGYIISSNPNAKTYIVETIKDDNGIDRSFTILDELLSILSQLIKNELSQIEAGTVEDLTFQRVWYFTELIKFLVKRGAEINKKNSDIYLDAFKTLILAYRQTLDFQMKEWSSRDFPIPAEESEWFFSDLRDELRDDLRELREYSISAGQNRSFFEKELADLSFVFNKFFPYLFEKFKEEIDFKSLKNERDKAWRRYQYQQQKTQKEKAQKEKAQKEMNRE